MDKTMGDIRRPWIAVAFSVICTGLGHVYCGRIVKGLVLFLITLLFLPATMASALAEPSWAVWAFYLPSAVVVILLGLYAVIDSYFVARRQKGPYALKEYNRAAIYILFALTGIAIPIVTALMVRIHAFEAFYVPVSSMAPNILKGDRFLVNKAAYRCKTPERGDVVVFRSPPNRRQNFIKRVVGLPGDTVAVRGHDVYLNGQRLPREEMPKSASSAIGDQLEGKLYNETNAGKTYSVLAAEGSSKVDDFEEITVPVGNYFVLGDNRDNSRDSRSFKFVPIGDILGRVQFVYFPAGSWSRFGVFED